MVPVNLHGRVRISLCAETNEQAWNHTRFQLPVLGGSVLKQEVETDRLQAC
jgi:uncharacterized protein YgfB (UPF0149 family)